MSAEASTKESTATQNRFGSNGRSGEPLLEVKNLQTQFFTQDGVVRAVEDVSFYVMPGETLGVVGESGSGKSITGLSIMRLIPSPPGKIVNGEVIFEGTDLLKLSDDQIRRIRGNQIAMIFQDPMTSLNPVLTINRQISEALQLHMGMSKDQAKARSIELLRMVGIPNAEERIDQYPHQFSGGMRQRVMIAMALSCRPETHHRRRADHRARRDDPGADSRSDADVADGARHRRDHDHPLHGSGGWNGRPRAGHVCRIHRGNGLDRRNLRESAASVYGRSDEIDPATRCSRTRTSRANSWTSA